MTALQKVSQVLRTEPLWRTEVLADDERLCAYKAVSVIRIAAQVLMRLRKSGQGIKCPGIAGHRFLSIAVALQ